MKQYVLKRSSYTAKGNEAYEGQTIEERIRTITETKEPITDGAPQIFTEKKDGVLPGYDIRTDKWDLALEAMDLATRQEIAQSANNIPKIDTPADTPADTSADN